MSEKSVSLAILGVVSVIAVVGLVMLFTGATANSVVVPGTSKAYGGALRQGESELRPIGEAPLRYTSPVENPDLQQYSHQESYYRDYFQWNRDQCPYASHPVVVDASRLGARPDCTSSQVRPDVYCCPTGGQAGNIAGERYG